MNHPIVLNLAVANAPSNTNVEEVFQFIEDSKQELETYGLIPPSDDPRVSRKAVFDYTIVLGAAGSIASLAALLWAAYDKFIAPKKTTETDNAGVYIGIREPDGTAVDFWIGNSYRDKDVFIEDFTKTVSSIRKSDEAKEWFSQTEAEIKNSKIWIRRK